MTTFFAVLFLGLLLCGLVLAFAGVVSHLTNWIRLRGAHAGHPTVLLGHVGAGIMIGGVLFVVLRYLNSRIVPFTGDPVATLVLIAMAVGGFGYGYAITQEGTGKPIGVTMPLVLSAVLGISGAFALPFN